MRPGLSRNRARIGRLEAKTAGAIDRADQDLQQVQGARRLEAVGMSRDAAHGVERHRPADHALVALALHVGPGLLDDHLTIECRSAISAAMRMMVEASIPVRSATAAGA